MTLELQYKINNNPSYLEYLHTHSYWYKFLNRDPSTLNDFLKEIKENNRLNRSNKIKDAIDTIDTLTSILSTLNS